MERQGRGGAPAWQGSDCPDTETQIHSESAGLADSTQGCHMLESEDEVAELAKPMQDGLTREGGAGGKEDV